MAARGRRVLRWALFGALLSLPLEPGSGAVSATRATAPPPTAGAGAGASPESGAGASPESGAGASPESGAGTQTPVDVTARSVNRDITAAVPICTCDLTGGVCDLDCCCDPDCSPADIDVFSTCLLGSEPVVSQMCIKESMIFTSNTPFPTVLRDKGCNLLFCVNVTDPKTNYFVPPRPVTKESFPKLVSQFDRGSFIIPSRPVFFNDGYRVGDQILTFFKEASVLGVFIQPVAVVGGECTDRNPAGFLQSSSSTCARRVRDLNTACDSLPALNAATYYENFVLLPTPNITIGSNQVKIIPEGREFLSSPWVMNDVCRNVVSEVTYWIEYRGIEGIVGARVVFALTNVSLSATKIQQTFHIFFVTNPTMVRAKRRSGNAGYLLGAPVLAFSGEVAASLTVLKSAGDGSCSRTGRNSVLFRQNMRAGCSYRFTPGQMCSNLQTQINLLLLGESPINSLGILGNASGSETEGLTRIINPVPEAPGVRCATSCPLSLALEIQILWAYLGPLANPQAAVLGARFQYQRQDVGCSISSVSLRTSVTFIETTRYPPAPRNQPAADWKLPFDFFHPFKMATSGVVFSAGSILGSVCSVIVVGFLGQL
ncbi:tectonic-3-like [Heptranchias perlo]|uniref:tectonic-3-like n=1 Tax=Heptranchias perlo TaxID=212740 RepID=UPI003559BBA2